MKFKTERICCTNSMSAAPLERFRFDLKASIPNLQAAGLKVEAQELYIITDVDGLNVTIYPSGRFLFHPLNDKVKAKQISEKLYALLVKEQI
jgi:hypothetical protein